MIDLACERAVSPSVCIMPGNVIDKVDLCDVGEPESGRDENINLDASPFIGLPTRRATVESFIRCPGFAGSLEVIAMIRLYDYPFYVFCVKLP